MPKNLYWKCTRKRWLLEMLEKVLRQMDKIILDDIVCSKFREQLGLHDLVEVIASNGEPIIRAVTAGSHEAYRRSLKGKTTLLLPHRMEFLRYLRE
jgi:hypothetical protein